MSSSSAVTNTTSKVFKDVIRRRNRDALKYVPKELQETFLDHWANWNKDNVPAPDQKIDKEWILKKYNISSKPAPSNATHLKLSSPFKDPEEYRINKLIEYEKELQAVHAMTQDGSFILDVHPRFKNRKYITILYSLLFLLVPLFTIAAVFNKGKLYENYIAGTWIDAKKTDKPEWDEVPVTVEWNNMGQFQLKKGEED